jgi:hypothetical protein
MEGSCKNISLLILIFLITGCSQRSQTIQNKDAVDILDISNVPPQPGEDTWKFIEDLSSPLWTKHVWVAKGANPQQADLSKGVTIIENYPDPGKRLETAYGDLRTFLAAGNVSSAKGDYVIETSATDDLEGESFRLEIGTGSCHIMAGDAEGIRRGIFNLEDEMLRLRGPYLPLGTTERHPAVKRRISRCVYGPIKRPPAMRDELMDDINYYPDQYMNRLAHEGVNGLWLSVDFRDLVSTKYNADAAKDREKRLKKLRTVVAQNLRYGIRTYLFTIEPRAWGNQPPYYMDINVLDNYPELGGVRRGNTVYFCPISKTAQDYLYQVVNTIFREVPGLGGMINISHGERATTCASALAAAGGGSIDCPRCSKKAPWEILYASLSAMERGMHDAEPDAELISWHYMGTTREYPDWVYEIPAHTPKGVILQFQFETGVTKTEFGKNLTGGDYWLSTPGPSERFERQAKTAREHSTQVSAKIQTGNSHEVASIPYVPAPTLIYKKFSAMHRLDVTHTMLGWYFGNYPGLMIKSAGELAFSPLPENEDAFLQRLASIYWKNEDVPSVVEALKKFSEGYGHYPLQAMLGYYGPVHDGPVWPLLLKPLDAPLSPTWQVGSSSTRKPWPPSGDRIGECLWGGGDRLDESMENVLTLKETVELCRRMTTTWDKGTAILNKLEGKYSNEPERILDIGLAKALGIQFRSGYNILHFYQLREEMFSMEGRERLDILKQLEEIIREELKMDEQLLALCENDSRLGFHSEAEGYKYFPEKIRWRMRQLKEALANDVPELKKIIRDGKLLFPEFTGKEPAGAVAYAIHTRDPLWPGSGSNTPNNLLWQTCRYGRDSISVRWASAYNSDTLYVIVADSANMNQSADISTISRITVKIEPRRLWPCAQYIFNIGDENVVGNRIRIVSESGKWYALARIPFKSFWWSEEEPHPVRVDVRVQKKNAGSVSWRPTNPVTPRLVFGTENPSDLGWLLFK